MTTPDSLAPAVDAPQTAHLSPQDDLAAAVERCVAQCRRQAARYALHLRRAQHVRDPLDDLLVLAARRLLPQQRRIVRPLPGATLPASARAFNALDRADRRALVGMAAPQAAQQDQPAGECAASLAAARDEHLASALARLVEGTCALQAQAARQQRAFAPLRPGQQQRPARKKSRPPP